MFDPELESLKTSIDLRSYAAGQGYTLDRKASWRGSAVMRHANGDKVIIKRDMDAHYVYFSVRDATDHGSIIDFVQRRLRLNLGAVRKELRPWIGKSAEVLPYPPLVPTAKDRTLVETLYAETEDAFSHPFLEDERAIPAAALRSDRFAGRIRIDARGNAVFPHFDGKGLCGFEIKNRHFTGFASGGTKGLWLSQEGPEDDRLAFCESAIDALSYAVLFPGARTRYASIGGQMNPEQPGLMRAAAAGMPLNAKIIAATDADADGRRFVESIREAVGETGRHDLGFVAHQPEGFKDWNDQLRNRLMRSLTKPHPEPSL
ncbi:MAG TPA: DUF3991 and TOPRIM domain-containing protein [Bryobacteraceae bacterium]|jgi:hypothetical protein|nr:DUF3991 and TOPRIM domain-containing protein [Bryobacteraceae bacterium]